MDREIWLRFGFGDGVERAWWWCGGGELGKGLNGRGEAWTGALDLVCGCVSRVEP